MKTIEKLGVKGLDFGKSGKGSMPRWQGGLVKHLAQYKRKLQHSRAKVNDASNGTNGFGWRASPYL